MEPKNILVGVCGGVASYKALDVVSALRKQGNRMRVILFIVFFFSSLSAFCQHTPRLWDFTVIVSDKTSKRLQDVGYIITYYENKDGKWSKQRLEGVTDASGSFSFKKKSLHMLSVSLRKDGYFSAGMRPELSQLVIEDGRWLPEGALFEVKMVEKEGERPLMAKQMDPAAQQTLIPHENEPIGYDLMKGDWVEPFGKGKINDLVFQARKTESAQGPLYAFVEYHVMAEGKGNGLIQVYNPKKGLVKNTLKLKLGTTAPDKGYKSKFEFVHAMGKGAEKYEKEPKDTAWDGKTLRDQADGYWVRIRSEVDPKTGEIISAHYGKIVSPFRIFSTRDGKLEVRFDYQISPDPNNRSVVWDRETTLIPGYTLPSWGARYY